MVGSRSSLEQRVCLLGAHGVLQGKDGLVAAGWIVW